MHQIKQVIAVLFISVSLFSCAKTEKVLVKHDGEWNIDKQVTTTTTGGISTTETDTDYGVATFNENGTGFITYNDGTSDTFSWSVNDDIISVTYDALATTVDYTIIDSSKDSQHWSGSYSGDIFGIPYVVDTEIWFSSLN